MVLDDNSITRFNSHTDLASSTTSSFSTVIRNPISSSTGSVCTGEGSDCEKSGNTDSSCERAIENTHDNNEAEVAALSSSRYAKNPTPVIRTNLASSFFQREKRNDMPTPLRGKNQQKAHDRYKKRTQEMHIELLKFTAKLLLLDESEAIALTPILMAEEDDIDPSLILPPFLHQLSSKKAAFQILSMLLFNFLLASSGDNLTVSSKSNERTILGYDARVRHAFKRLAVVILNVDDNPNNTQEQLESMPLSSPNGVGTNQSESTQEKQDKSVKKFENLEHVIASRLLLLSRLQQTQADQSSRSAQRYNNYGPSSGQMISWEKPKVVFRDKLLRAASILGAGLAAGTIFAVSGGLAAPGIAATVGMVAGSTVAATAAVVTLTGTIAMSTIFGVSGAGLVAAKVGARTRGLSEFVFKRDLQTRNQVELTRTLCISGWIRDNLDFDRPWGITPEGLSKTEKLQRFFSVYDPEKVDKCELIMEQWQGREEQFWDLLRDTHGRDPDHLLPLRGPMDEASLDEQEHTVVDRLVETLGFPQLSRRAGQIGHYSFDNENKLEDSDKEQCNNYDSSQAPHKRDRRPVSIFAKGRPWDFHATFGGELYTVHWEPDLLLALNDSMGVSTSNSIIIF